MNKYLNNWMVYHELQRLAREGKKASQIASYMVMDQRTIKKYLSMSEQEYMEYQESLSCRLKKLKPYEDFVRERLEACQEASAAQVHDWLKECHSDFKEVSTKTVYNFVLYVREKYRLPKVFAVREFSKVPELPYGQQVQVDFGECHMGCSEGQRKKVYFFAMVLSRSRYKYVLFSESPFTTATAIDAHEKAFACIGGYPAEVVYDQDKVFLTNENKGDLLLTQGFRAYCATRPFQLHFCRKSDPQSKGKVENVIKYIKYNLLRGRTYADIHILNAQATEWLERTANAKEHATTRLPPVQQWMIEKNHLQPLRPSFELVVDALQYKVRKDNTISFKGNFYSLPLGTYKTPDCTVVLIPQDDELIIQSLEGQELARHKIAHLKGILVSNNNHFRDSSVGINELIAQVAGRFSDKKKAALYLESIRKQYRRYVRDQLRIIRTVCEKYTIGQCDHALHYCIENEIYKASDFESVLLALPDPDSEKITGNKQPNKLRPGLSPQRSNLNDYKQLLN